MEQFAEHFEQVKDILDRLRREELEPETMEELQETAETELAAARALLADADGDTFLVTGDDDPELEPFNP